MACGTGLVAMACSQALVAEKNAGTNVRWQPFEPSGRPDRDD
jgi:hypothetical protein